MMNDDPIIMPRKNRDDPDIGPDSLLTCLPSELRHLCSAHNARRVALKDASMSRVYIVEKNGSAPISLCGPFLGAPHGVMVMEKLIALGAQRLWMLGWCGSLSSKMKVGDILIPSVGFSEEGTSRHYPISFDKPVPDHDLCEMLQRNLECKGAKPFTGSIWSTDAPYRETKAKIRKYQELGVVAVDMEWSALATVALYRGVKFAAIMVVSDELFDYVWKPGFKNPRLRTQTRLASQALFEVASSFSTPPLQNMGSAKHRP